MTTSALKAGAALDSQPVKAQLKWSLDYLPIGLFGSVMGLTGLSVAWRLAHDHFGTPAWAATAVAIVAVAAFVALVGGYGFKLATAPKAVAAEFRHPIAGNLFGTFLISVLLVPVLIAPLALTAARVMWTLGAIGMFGFAWMIIHRWMSNRQQVAHATPAWIVPVVGLLDVPLAVPALDMPVSLHGVMVAALAIGLFFAIPLFTLILSRLIFEEPMPNALKPSLLILVAPFAVGMSTYVVTVGTVDLFAEALYMLTLFVLAILLGHMRNIVFACPFRVTWWAVSFPLAASAIAALRFATAQPSPVADLIAVILLALATVTIVGLLARTLIGLGRGELRTLSS